MFLDSKDVKRIWFYLNLAFICNYSLYILKIFVRLPVLRLPNFFNILLLVLAYGITLIDVMKNFSKMATHPNTLCIGLFLTFPHPLLLLPFYLLSVYHTNSFVLAQKKSFERFSFYKACVVVGQYSSQLGRGAMYAEVINIPLSIVLSILGLSSLKTSLAFIVIVRQQYLNNSTMKNVVGEMIMYVDRAVDLLPVFVKDYYIRAKSHMSRFNTPSIPKKNE